MPDQVWELHLGDGPFVATALHNGHEVREEVLRHMVLDEPSRLREEDPYTGQWAEVAPTRIVALRSRFEVDLNRPRGKAVYRTVEDSWGLKVWDGGLPEKIAEESLAEYDAFYAKLGGLYRELADRYGRFVVYDIHSYNHRRAGPDASPEDPQQNPQVNIGTGTMKNRAGWAPVIDRFKHDLAAFDFPGGNLDVRENVKFFGGNCAQWTHETFPDAACVLSVEFKKFFMDEWTSKPNAALLDAIRRALSATVPGLLEELARL